MRVKQPHIQIKSKVLLSREDPDISFLPNVSTTCQSYRLKIKLHIFTKFIDIIKLQSMIKYYKDNKYLTRKELYNAGIINHNKKTSD
jgi:hypothetical protein